MKTIIFNIGLIVHIVLSFTIGTIIRLMVVLSKPIYGLLLIIFNLMIALTLNSFGNLIFAIIITFCVLMVDSKKGIK